jgi:hypothetical protein
MPSCRRAAWRLGLADAGRAGEQEVADRLVGLPRPERAILIAEPARRSPCPGRTRRSSGRGRGSSARRGRRSTRAWAGCARSWRRSPRSRACRSLLLLAWAGCAARAPASSITSIALSGRWRSLMCLRRQLGRGLSASAAYFTPWCSSKRDFRPFRISTVSLDRRLDDVDLLEAPRQRAVLLEDAAVLLERGRADALQLARGQRGLEQVGRVQRAARRAPAPMSVWISSMKRIAFGLSTSAASAPPSGAARNRRGTWCRRAARPCRARRPDRVLGEHSGTSPSTMRQARPSAIAVLPTPASPTSSGLFLRRRHRIWITRSSSSLAADQRIDLAVEASWFRFWVNSRARRPCCRLRRLGFAARLLALLLGACGAFALGDAVRDVVDDVEARHALLVQEIDGVRILLAEDRDQHVGAGDFLLAGGLHVQDRRAGSRAGSRASGWVSVVVGRADRGFDRLVQQRGKSAWP